MPAIGFLVSAIWAVLSRLVIWVIRYVAPGLLTMFALRASKQYVLLGISLTFYLSTFVAVMTFVNNKATELLGLLFSDSSPYWLTAFSMLPTNILSCLTVVFLSYSVYLVFRFKIFISRLITSKASDVGGLRKSNGKGRAW